MKGINNQVNGFLLLDKPSGISSNLALQKVKKILKVKKAGYIGTLDPIATGMLPICLGKATKFAQYLVNSDKHYYVRAKLGERTDTLDCQGKIISESPVINISTFKLKDLLKDFVGKIKQIPPMYSAIKFHNHPLYHYARKGIVVSRKARYIIIHNLELIDFITNELVLKVHCSKGTYIRTLIDDLGEKLGCGAHVIELRRLQIDSYPLDKMISIEKLSKLINPNMMITTEVNNKLNSILTPIESLVSSFPEIHLVNVTTTNLKKGVSIDLIMKSSLSGVVRVTQGKEKKLMGIAEINNKGLLISYRLVY
ncbi:MAG: tRNA pseudouridine(55) synthase TruB [Candidatus Dasytiphilus stammeri]